MPTPSEKPKRKLNHPMLGAFGFGVKNLPEGVSYVDQYRAELRQLTGQVRVRTTNEEKAKAIREGKDDPEWKRVPEWKLMVDQRREYLKMLQGDNRLIRNFKDLENRYPDPKDLERDPERYWANVEFANKLLDNLADRLASYVVPDQVEDPELRRVLAKGHLPSLSEAANNFMTWIKDTHMPNGDIDALEVSNEVIIACTNPAELILLANDHRITKEDEANLTPDEKRRRAKIRLEALRKVYLMFLAAKVMKFRDAHADDLKFFDQLVKNYMIPPDKGFGEHETKYLVSEHLVLGNNDENGGGANHRCVGSELYGTLEKANAGLKSRGNHLSSNPPDVSARGFEIPKVKKILTPIEMRSFDVGEGENEEVVEGRMHVRFKELFSCMLKLLRKDMPLSERPEEDMGDLNGVRFSMADSEKIRRWIEKFKQNASRDYSFEEIEKENAIGKDGALKCIKNIWGIDGKRFEVQFFTYPEHADYEYSQPHSRDLYEIMRFIESSCSEALYPSEIYGDIDRKEYEKMAKEKILSERRFMVGGMHEFQPSVEA